MCLITRMTAGMILRIPAENGHRSGGKAAGIPLGKRPPFRSNPASKK
jgi:hypothetical protein